MTEAELDRLEAHWGKVHSCDCPVCPFDSEDARELLAEVRRVRGLVREAFNEGFGIGLDDPGNRDYWPESEVRKALEGA